ncbi:hypothetical protein BVI2075_320233 [Burkholderia vietnamiensis]|nr:hypothetical protein BVI2075_320233 [Burkholderia vietnamiensis]
MKPHLLSELPKRWAKTGRETEPASSHPSLHRQTTVYAGAMRVLGMRAPEKPHLGQI